MPVVVDLLHIPLAPRELHCSSTYDLLRFGKRQAVALDARGVVRRTQLRPEPDLPLDHR